MTLSCLTYLAGAAASDWNIGKLIQLKHNSKNTRELSLGKSLRRLDCHRYAQSGYPPKQRKTLYGEELAAESSTCFGVLMYNW